MPSIRVFLLLLMFSSSALFAQKTNDLIRELQRDLATMQQDLKSLNSKFDERIAVITTLLNQALRESDSASKGVAVIDRELKNALKEQQGLVVNSLAPLGNKVDGLSTDYSSLSENVKELSVRLNKQQVTLEKILTAVTTIQQPSVPPPGAPQASGPAGCPPAPGVGPEQVYTQAMRDKDSGNADVALIEFQDYLRCWPNEEKAGDAQFYLAETLYNLKKDFEAAVTAYDTVLEKYPDHKKAPDAMYMKGRALMMSDQRVKAKQVLQELIKIYPNSEAARRAKGVVASMAPAATPKKRK
ncbi:MAG: tetratricopeptide repeat protein [Acidobacteria bacterium]|nr:tetratricopeptide repeat protein [Acidobacteriota bacterium]